MKIQTLSISHGFEFTKNGSENGSRKHEGRLVRFSNVRKKESADFESILLEEFNGQL